MKKHLIIFLSALFIVPLCVNAEKDAQQLVSELLELTSSPVAQTESVAIPEIKTDDVLTNKVSASEETALDEMAESEDERVPHTVPGGDVYIEGEEATQAVTQTNIVLSTEEEKDESYNPPGTLVGKTTDHRGRPIKDIKVVLFSDESYKEMLSTPGGNFGFSITASNEYTLTAKKGNQFLYTNLYLVPSQGEFMALKFKVPITVYGQLFMDGKPAQYGLLLRLISRHGGQAGGIVQSNGYFHIKNLTPGKYTMVFERRKRFIDRRLNETRFYYVPVTLTTETARIYVQRDIRRLIGNVVIEGLPRRNVDALVILKDAQSNGMLIHREAHTYYNQGYFVFENILPGKYILQAAQNQREWMSEKVFVEVKADKKTTKVVIDVMPDPNTPARRLRNLRRQFLD